MRRWIRGFALLLLVAPAARSQEATGTQLIVGRVLGPDTLPLSGVRIEVTSVETKVVRRTTTRSDGRFAVLFRDGGAQYRLTAAYIGMTPAAMVLTRQADEDRLVAEIRLGRNAVTLSAMQIRSTQNRPGMPVASTAGSTERLLPATFLERLPLSQGDLAAVAALTPGVVPVAGTDSTAGSFSVSGQPPSQNNVSVDGGSFLFGTLPKEGVRAVRVVTNTYDVSRGQFTGAQVSTVTKSGTSIFQGSTTVSRQQPSLQFPASTASTFPQEYTRTTASAGLGGPVKGTNAFYFGSLEYDRRADPFPSLTGASPATLARLGVNSDSVARFREVAEREGATSPTLAPTARTSSTLSTLMRMDWDLSETSTLMIRGDFRRIRQDALRVSALSLPETGGTAKGYGAGVMASMTSGFGNFINQARASRSTERQEAAPFLNGPRGIVLVGSDLEQGTTRTLLQFGGNPGLPSHARTTLVEGSDEISWLTGGSHRLKLGTTVTRQRLSLDALPNQFGTFTYGSLADFDAGRPASFARTLSAASGQEAAATTTALYLGDAWRPTGSLQIVYGVRGESTRLPGTTDVRVSPRVGFTFLTWNEGGLPSSSLKGGIGEFRGTVPLPLLAAASPGAQQLPRTLLCVGGAVPTAAWSSYLADPSSVPMTCESGSPAAFASLLPNSVSIERGFGAPAVRRASLGYTHSFGERSSIGLDGSLVMGVHGPFAIDRNLPAPSFTIGAEGNRPVYARASDIVPATGSTGAATTRPDAAFGSIVGLRSGFRSRTGELSLSILSPGLRSGFTSLSYTWSRVLDESNGFAAGSFVPTTAGDPNAREWGTSDLERRHQGLATVFVPLAHGFDFTLIGRLLSGARFTPMVQGDINGDGAANDRAFVPALDDPVLGAGLNRLLATTNDEAGACLRSQAGGIAGRNSCASPWTTQLDLRLNWVPRSKRLANRLTISLETANTLAGLDRLLHGGDVRGWGQPASTDRTLLTVTGFDASAQRFLYAVNEHFGARPRATTAFAAPFQLGLRAHVTLGSDPVKAQLNALTGGSSSLQAMKERILRGVPYPVADLVRLSDSLRLNLSGDQRRRLEAIASAYAREMDSVGTVVARILLDAGPNPDPIALGPKIQKINVGIIRTLQTSVKDAQAVLTESQWKLVPERIRLPLAPPGGR